MNPIKEVLKRQRGIASYCTSNELVLEACMEEAGKDGYVLVEATANQVNQFGGYTGMNAADFVKYAERIAERSNLPKGKLLLGGDHLGPLVWSSEPEDGKGRTACSGICSGRFSENSSGYKHETGRR